MARKRKIIDVSGKRKDLARVDSKFSPLMMAAVLDEALKRGWTPTVQPDQMTRFTPRQDGWMNQITGLGIFGQDKKMGNQFVGNFIVSAMILDNIYRGDAITQRVIDIFPMECIRKWISIRGDDDELIEKKMRELDFKEKLRVMGKYARLYGGAICIVGINDGRALDKPVNENSIRSIDYLQVYDRYQAWSADGTYDFDLNSPNYGHPVLYRVTDPMTAKEYIVHYSRVLRMDGVELPPRRKLVNNGWGDSMLVSCYAVIRDYCCSMSNMATMFEDMVKMVLRMPGFNVQIMSQEGYNALQNRVNSSTLSSANTNFLLLDKETEFEKHSSSLAGVADISDRLALQLAAVVGVPATKLFGRSPTGLNATGQSELVNFYDDISAVQEQKFRRPIERLARLIMLAQDGDFAGKELEDWEVKFTPLMQMTEKEEAEVHKIQAESDKIYLEMGVLSPEEIRKSRFGVGGYSTDTVATGSPKIVQLNKAQELTVGQDNPAKAKGH